MFFGSLPSRERGLKSLYFVGLMEIGSVAPLAGAWIEISNSIITFSLSKVAPLAGAWIEIFKSQKPSISIGVAPLAGAWIEIWIFSAFLYGYFVAPLAGAWIEIQDWTILFSCSCRRSPRGSVD